jgi:hypothetical protein
MRPPECTFQQTIMTPNLDSCQIRGSVVETIEMDGRTVLRVSITGGSLDFVSDADDTFHLGDSLLLHGEFRLFSVKPVPDPEDHHTVQDADFLS